MSNKTEVKSGLGGGLGGAVAGFNVGKHIGIAMGPLGAFKVEGYVLSLEELSEL